MGARYCRQKNCSENLIQPCPIAGACWLFEPDLDPIIKAKETKQTKQPKKTVSGAMIAKEEQEQAAFVAWCALQGITVFHIPNEGKRSEWVGERQRAQGLSAGVPDLMIPIPANGKHGLFIEMKRPKPLGRKPTAEQVRWIDRLNASGYVATVCYGQESAKKAVKEYLKTEIKT